MSRRTNVLFAMILFLLTIVPMSARAEKPDGNRLAYLDGVDPYYPHKDFPKLITPHWVGEPGVEAVVVLAIDDMTNNTAKYERYLRPILNRLKLIDGRAPLSIMTNRVDPQEPRLQAWLKEGLSIECHTLTHPCPLLQKGDFAEAQRTYHGCVDLLSKIPGNTPVAFRMPCCDSLNTPSPRFFAEIFNKTSPENKFLSIDSSVFMLFTPDDPSLPRELVLDPDGGERFRKYVPFPSFVNTIENYPYPYTIGNMCWEFPCIVPSDWEGQNINRPNSLKTLEDLKAALDLVVLKQGVFNLVFHPHGWIENKQVVELIDHAVMKHGKKVKFLNFREAQERLNKNLLGGHPIRDPEITWRDNGVRVLDLDNDKFMDLLVSNRETRKTRLWEPGTGSWKESKNPGRFTLQYDAASGVKFGVVSDDGKASLIAMAPGEGKDGQQIISDGSFVIEAYRIENGAWTSDSKVVELLKSTNSGLKPFEDGEFVGALRDLDGDGCCEIICVKTDAKKADDTRIYSRDQQTKQWKKLAIALPDHAGIGRFTGVCGGRLSLDDGTRLIDLDEDGQLDFVFSNAQGYGIYLFDSLEKGWSRKVMAGKAGEPGALPMIVRADGSNNGFFVHSRTLWWQNENTAKLPNLVDRRTFNDLLKNVEPRGKSPKASLDSIRVPAGFRLELMASEPLVNDPIAFEWGADGKLWVVEMGDYPLGVDGKGKPGGVVRFLEDTNNDSKYDKATTFLEGLNFPTGVMPWRKGVLVACAPDIFYAEDMDGDGKADLRKTLFSGFGEGNQQHRLNGFELGLDGWIYGANGDSGGRVHLEFPGKTVSIDGRDFRFKPVTESHEILGERFDFGGEFEAESGQTQYGRHRDDWGNWFGNNNPNWGWHFVLTESDMRRNPHFAPPDPKQTLEADTRLHPTSRTLQRFNYPNAANRVTSANSITPYRDDLFGPHFASSVFVSEPVHNLVHRIVLEPDGITFRGHRAKGEVDREFLSSSDNWFRPTMLKTGPDGALWIADMYRAVIEHPEWIPPQIQAKIDLRAGSQEGRIYRVVPVDKQARPIHRLDRLDTPGLVAALDNPSGWQRDTAMRLLLERTDRSAIAPLKALAKSSKRPQARIQAVWCLSHLHGLGESTALAALADSHPQVRRNAIKATEQTLAARPKVADAVIALAGDADPAVRFQVALSLGNWDDPKAGRALARVIKQAPDDPWVRAAVMSSAVPHVSTLLVELLRDESLGASRASYIEPLIALAGSLNDRSTIDSVVHAIGNPAGQGRRFAPWQYDALAGLITASGQKKQEPGSKLVLGSEASFNTLEDSARALIGNDSAPEAERISAIRLMGVLAIKEGGDRDRLLRLIKPQTSTPIVLSAIVALGRSTHRSIPQHLLNDWKSYSPAVRDAVLDLLLSRAEWTAALLSSLEDTCVSVAEIDATHRARLLAIRNREFRSRAAALFAQGTGKRQDVVDAYNASLSLKGDSKAGANIFEKSCASCHRLGNVGIEVGPDLTALKDKAPQALLTAILDPNRVYEAKYANFTVATTDGRISTGLIASESSSSITFRRQEGKQEVLLRSEIEQMNASGQSLMPEGLEKDLTLQNLADLMTFLGSALPATPRMAPHSE